MANDLQVNCRICGGTGDSEIHEVPMCSACGGTGKVPAPAAVKVYVKKPIPIQAVQLTWSNWNAVCDFVPKPWFKVGCYLDADGKPTNDTNGRLGLRMQTLESQEFIAQENDFIIKGVEGEFYACKPSVFSKTYEAAE
jgi:hypothetical protein